MPCIPVFVPATAVSGGGLWPDNLYFALSDRATHSEIECNIFTVDRHWNERLSALTFDCLHTAPS